MAASGLPVHGVRPFAHLQSVSGYSLKYGTATPQALAERAAGLGMSIMALTDRDGLYGAVQWALACQKAGVRPVIGVDLAVEFTHPQEPIRSAGSTRAHALVQPKPRRTPAHGGTWIDETRPRAVFLAAGARGWASLCRLVSAAHAEPAERGEPWLSWAAMSEHREGVVALLGPDSELGRAMAAQREYRADALVRPWRAIFDRFLGIAVSTHHEPGQTAVAGATLRWARKTGLPAVLVNAVRYLEPADARVADVLDSARRLVPLRSRHIAPANGEACVKSAQQMGQLADEIAAAAGERSGDRLLADTWRLAEYCVLDPARDMGIGEVFVPELDVLVGRPVPAESAVAEAQALLRARCEREIPGRYGRAGERRVARARLVDELSVIEQLGFAGYFLTVAEVVDLIRARGVRVAARGSGAGSLVNHLLGISGVDPIRHDLLMERFLSPLRRVLPDIDIDVESARREEIYDWVFERFGLERTACVSMMETYRVRHAVRDVGFALGMPAGEVDALAKSFPHIRARDARNALTELPELRNSGFGRLAASGRLDSFLDLVEALDGLPRHVALHPCGIVLSDTSLLARTPVERSAAGFPMSHFDKDDVEHMGLLKLDVLGVRMQSAMAHALDEIERVSGARVQLDESALDDPATFELIRSTRTLGCFQIESPGQRELLGKFAPENFGDIIIDISLFRPGPVKSDMVTPFLRARQGWCEPSYVHPDLEPALSETYGVVVFHEQVLRIVAVLTGCTLAQADEVRRSLGSPQGQDDVRAWFYPAAVRQGYDLAVIDQAWEVLRAFASFGFCKAHAAAFALPTYQSAWLKAHHPAAFYAGVLTHDPGMYPKRLILDDARVHGVPVLGLDINASSDEYRVEQDVDGRLGVRVPLSEVAGIAQHEVERLVRSQPYSSLSDAWQRGGPTRTTAERLVVTGAFDAMYRLDQPASSRRRGSLTRRDLLLQIADLERLTRNSARTVGAHEQLALGVSDIESAAASGLPEMTDADRVKAELEVLGLDVSRHVIGFYADLLAALHAAGVPVVQSKDLLRQRSQSEVFVAGVKVATQTPPVRSGRRVIFLTLDDSTGPVDAALFDDVQEPYASTVFGSWLLLARGVLRRTGPRGISVRATGCWELGALRTVWLDSGIEAVIALLEGSPGPRQATADEARAEKRRVLVHASGFRQSPYADIVPAGSTEPPAKLWHSSPGSSGW